MTDCPIEDTVRDFSKTHLPASYGGVPFEVRQDSRAGGRRLQVHEYPGRDFWDNEDLGRATKMVTVEGFVDGPLVEARAEALEEMCSMNAAHLLVLPFRVPFLARCMICTSSVDTEKMGVITFQMEFVLEPMALGGLFANGMLAQQVSDVVSASLDTLAHTFGKRFDVLARRHKTKRVPAVARDAAAATINSAGLTLQDLLSRVTISDPEAATAADLQTRFIRDQALYLAYQGQKADRIKVDLFVRDQAPADSEFAVRWTKLLRHIYRVADQPDGVADMARALTKFERVDTTPGPNTQSVLMEQALADEVSRVVRMSGLMVHAQAAVRQRFRTRPEAIAVRAELASAIQTEIERPPSAEVRGIGDQESEEALSDVRDAAVRFLSQQGDNLPDVLVIELKSSLPAAVIATELYNDCSRDEELVTRNRAPHPLFMPGTIEALRY